VSCDSKDLIGRGDQTDGVWSVRFDMGDVSVAGGESVESVYAPARLRRANGYGRDNMAADIGLHAVLIENLHTCAQRSRQNGGTLCAVVAENWSVVAHSVCPFNRGPRVCCGHMQRYERTSRWRHHGGESFGARWSGYSTSPITTASRQQRRSNACAKSLATLATLANALVGRGYWRLCPRSMSW
jgi:hypothetical protein